jgi:hypothetical protein
VIVEILDGVARDMEAITRKLTLARLESRQVAIHTSTRLTRLEGDKAFIRAGGATEETLLGCFDSVLMSVGSHSYDPLSSELTAAGLPVAVVGDAIQPGHVYDATQSGHRAVEEFTAGPS